MRVRCNFGEELLDCYGKVLATGAGFDKAPVVFEHGCCCGVSELGGGAFGIAGEFVLIAGVAVPEDIVRPGDAGGFDEGGEAFWKAVCADAV